MSVISRPKTIGSGGGLHNCPQCGVTLPSPNDPQILINEQTKFHNEWHRLWLQGIPATNEQHTWEWDGVIDRMSLTTVTGIVELGRESNAANTLLVWEMAFLLYVELRHVHAEDMVFMGWPKKPQSWNEEPWLAPRAFLRVEQNRVIGLLITRERPMVEWVAREGTAPPPTSRPLERRPCLDRLFVCGAWRRQGIARGLVMTAADHYRLQPNELAWTCPSQAADPLIDALYDHGGFYITVPGPGNGCAPYM